MCGLTLGSVTWLLFSQFGVKILLKADLWVSNYKEYLGFEVVTAVVMNDTIFWYITPCGLLSVDRSFGGTYRLHLQGRKNEVSKKPA
jgi:hypothetical protein